MKEGLLASMACPNLQSGAREKDHCPETDGEFGFAVLGVG
jgi:hypothetical protein